MDIDIHPSDIIDVSNQELTQECIEFFLTTFPHSKLAAITLHAIDSYLHLIHDCIDRGTELDDLDPKLQQFYHLSSYLFLKIEENINNKDQTND